MKVVKNYNRKKNNSFKHLPIEIKNNLEFNESRTLFWKSFLFLIIEAFIPFLLLFLLTSPNLKFSYHYNIWIGIGFGIIIIFIIFLLTLIGFFLNFHKADQFTYTISLSWTLFGIYLTDYWWGWDKILYRCLFSFIFLLFAIFLGTFMTVWINNISKYFKIKKCINLIN